MRSKQLGEFWAECYICGLMYPYSEMSKAAYGVAKGQWVCNAHCLDEPSPLDVVTPDSPADEGVPPADFPARDKRPSPTDD